MRHLTFLSHFALCLGLAAGTWFATRLGVVQTVWTNDASMMTSAIAALFVITTIHLGWQAWQAEGPARWRAQPQDTAFGHLAERLSTMGGLIGTGLGLSMQAKALVSGAASFGALSTALYTTVSGVTAAALIAIMVHNLEAGIRRARR